MTTPPDDSNTSFEGILSLVKDLDQRGQDELRTQLEKISRASSGSNETFSPPWPEVLQLLFHPDRKSVSLRNMLDVLRDHGFSKSDGIRKIASLLDHSSQKADLEDWKQLTDREELRIRLKVLTHCRSLPANLIPFLTFFFRSSNPLIYREAALAIGAHLASSDSLQEQVLLFAERRNIPLNRPIVPNGERGRRRLLLIQTSALTHGTSLFDSSPDSEPQVPFALDEDAGISSDASWLSNHLPEDPSDRSVLYDVVGLLYQHSSTRKLVSSIVLPFLNVAVEDESIRLSRSILRRWGALLSEYARETTASDPSPETGSDMSVDPASLWFRMRHRILQNYRDRDQVSASLKRFLYWNELNRTVPASSRRWGRK